MVVKRQRGVALVVILLLLAVMVTIAASMADRLLGHFKQASNQINYQQAYWYSVGAEALAKVKIKQSYSDSDTINLSQPWALEEQSYPLDFGTLKGRLLDKQACFNINALARVESTTGSDRSPYLVDAFQHLLEGLGVENYQAKTIAQSLLEYVDGDSLVNSTSGVEDSFYESMSPAYMAANSLLADSSELRAINHISGDVMERVSPYVCALPTPDFRLNVNTLKSEHASLLVALFYPALDLGDATQVLDNRPFEGWSSVDDFLSEPVFASVAKEQQKEVKGYLAVTSVYFGLDAELLVGDARVRVRSLLFSGNQETVTVIRRRFGGIGERVSQRSTEQ